MARSKNGRKRFEGKLGSVVAGLRDVLSHSQPDSNMVALKARKAASLAGRMDVVLDALPEAQARTVRDCLARAAR